MQGIQKVYGAAEPFVSMFYGTASTYLWEDDEGTTHKIVQIEGGEQGDAMMLLLFLWVNNTHWKKCNPNCFLVSSCSRIWTTYMSSIRQNALVLCTRCSRTHSGESQESAFNRARPRSGIGLGRNLQCVMFGAHGSHRRPNSVRLAKFPRHAKA